jgi:hypothetical protein
MSWINSSADYLLKTDDHAADRNDWIGRTMRIRGVSRIPANNDLDIVRGSIDRPLVYRNRPPRYVRVNVRSYDGRYIVEGISSGRNGSGSGRIRLLTGLKERDQWCGKFGTNVPRCAEDCSQRGHVHVVPAGVHAPICGRKRCCRSLGDRQRVELGTHSNRQSGSVSGACAKACAGDWLDLTISKRAGDPTTSFIFVVAELWMLV